MYYDLKEFFNEKHITSWMEFWNLKKNKPIPNPSVPMILRSMPVLVTKKQKKIEQIKHWMVAKQMWKECVKG